MLCLKSHLLLLSVSCLVLHAACHKAVLIMQSMLTFTSLVLHGQMLLPSHSELLVGG